MLIAFYIDFLGVVVHRRPLYIERTDYMILNVSKVKRILANSGATDLANFTGVNLRAIQKMKSGSSDIEAVSVGSLLKIQYFSDDTSALAKDDLVDLSKIEILLLDNTAYELAKKSGLARSTVQKIKDKGLQAAKLSSARKLLNLNHVTIDLMKLEKLLQDTPLQELAAKCDLTSKELHTLERSDLDALTIGTAKKLIKLL